jgi:hypothetical protein
MLRFESALVMQRIAWWPRHGYFHTPHPNTPPLDAFIRTPVNSFDDASIPACPGSLSDRDSGPAAGLIPVQSTFTHQGAMQCDMPCVKRMALMMMEQAFQKFLAAFSQRTMEGQVLPGDERSLLTTGAM